MSDALAVKKEISAAQPFVKWAGGKRALLPEILARLPKKARTYYEPFIGGGAVFFALAAEKRFERAHLSDSNAELVATYVALRSDIAGVLKALKHHAQRHSEIWFYRTRALNSKELGRAERAARFIYLNRTCFNGLYRVNRKGEFNVPFGKYVNPTICDEENLRAVSSVLKASDALVHAHDFEVSVVLAGKNDAVYFDSPYAPVSETANFTSYTASGFTAKDQERLRDTAEILGRRGTYVLLSNADTPFVRKLYKGFKIEEVRAPRRINSKGDKRGDVGELLISWKAR